MAVEEAVAIGLGILVFCMFYLAVNSKGQKWLQVLFVSIGFLFLNVDIWIMNELADIAGVNYASVSTMLDSLFLGSWYAFYVFIAFTMIFFLKDMAEMVQKNKWFSKRD